MTEINLIKIDGKPLEKLIDVISKGIGTIYRPRAIRKDAEAKAYEIEILERAKAIAIAEGKEIDANLYNRMQERVLYKETKRQINIDNVVQVAAQQLNYEDSISEEPVAEDWSTRFFNIVEDISDEEMQKIWGRILAGEVKQPKSYSLRTLELLKNLSKGEADIFMKFANLILDCGQGNYAIFNNDGGKFIETEFGITFQDRLLMSELGLIISEANLSLNYFETLKQGNQTTIVYGNKVIILRRDAETPDQSIEVLVFTKTGCELARLIEQKLSTSYVRKICEAFKCPTVKIYYADVKFGDDGQMFCTNAVDMSN